MTEGAFYLIRNTDELKRYQKGLIDHTAILVNDGPVFIKVARYTHPKSLSQNDMFRGLCRDISDWWNLNKKDKTSPEAVARDLKVEFGVILTEYSPVTGKRAARLKSTADYTQKEMSDLITATLAWAADNKIPLEPPHEQTASVERNHAPAARRGAG